MSGVTLVPIPPVSEAPFIVIIVDAYKLQDPITLLKARRALAALGHGSAVILATGGVTLARPLEPISSLPTTTACPATAPHEATCICKGTGSVDLL